MDAQALADKLVKRSEHTNRVALGGPVDNEVAFSDVVFTTGFGWQAGGHARSAGAIRSENITKNQFCKEHAETSCRCLNR